MPVGAVPFPFGKCRICKDRATGVHYGVATCEGCKGFFKRSITKAEKYKCFFGGECDVTPKNRNRCKSCRFRLCLENGMSVEAVRMGRIPKIEKEKALEAVVTHDTDVTCNTFQSTLEQSGDCPRYESVLPSKTESTGPDIYDFDTGCISKQTSTITDDRCGQVSETVSSVSLQGQRSFEEASTPVVPQQQLQIPVTTDNSQVKCELSGIESTPCCQPQYGINDKNSSMEVLECAKETDDLGFKRNENTYQHSNTSCMDFNNSFERNPIFDKPEQQLENFESSIPYQGHPYTKNNSNTFINTHRNPAHFSFVDTIASFDHSLQFCSNNSQPGLYGDGDLGNSSMTTGISATPHISSLHGPGAGENNDNPVLHGNSLKNPSKMANESPMFKTEPLEISGSHCDPRQEGNSGSRNHTQAPVFIGFDSQRAIKEIKLPEICTSEIGTVCNPASEINEKKEVVSVEFSRPDRPASVLSVPPVCPTPSSADGSTTSSQRGRFSPGLIKVLLEQVLDTTQEHDVALRLKQRLEQNKMDKKVVANVLNLIREVSAKRNRLAGSEETNILSPVESYTEESSSLSESKMENIQRFLEDVNKFSRPQPLGTLPYCQRSNISCSTVNRFERQYSESNSDSPPFKKRRFFGETKGNFPVHEQQSATSVLVETGECKFDIVPFGQKQDQMSSLHATAQELIVKESVSPQNNQSNKRYLWPQMTLTPNEQIGKVESSEIQSEFTQNSLVMPSDLIEQSINENRVTCSDDKLSQEDVKKQVIQMTLEGLSVASKILHRLKPEHREIFRLRKLGLMKLRVLSDSDEDVKELYKKIIDDIPEVNERILGFCERVPGFSSINAEDRGILMKRAYYDIWMLHSSEYFFDDDVNILVSGEIYSRKPMEKILNKDIVATLIEFANSFNRLHLSDLEVSILCAARLTCSDDLEVKDRSTIQKLHSLMLDVLAIEIEQNHPDNHTRLLIDIFRLMPLLATVNKMQCEIIAKYSLDKPEQVEDDNKAAVPRT